jgi:hypothetical protein
MASKPRLTIDVTPEIRQQVKVRAAMEDVTVSEWVLGLILSGHCRQSSPGFL